jgi:hypothetical protein
MGSAVAIPQTGILLLALNLISFTHKGTKITIHFSFAVYNRDDILKRLSQYVLNLSSIYRNLEGTQNRIITLLE